MRVIQFYNAGGYGCDPAMMSEDGYLPGPGDTNCGFHASDYDPADWEIILSELLRAVQFFNTGGYVACPDAGTEDGYCPAS
jgi:hypothetical protein